jgi:TrmH family RNA methyltransferase
VRVEAFFSSPVLQHDEPCATLIGDLLGMGAPGFEVSERLLRRMVDRDGPDGLAALVRWRPHTLADVQLTPTARLLVADRPEHPGNLGTMIRCADGSGARAVVVSGAFRLARHQVLKASMGALFTTPVVSCEPQRAIRWLKGRNVRIVAADPRGSRSYRAADYHPPVAVVVGNERSGLSSVWLEAADERVSIPMLGAADSLNVAIAAGLVLYEAMHTAPDGGCRPRRLRRSGTFPPPGG